MTSDESRGQITPSRPISGLGANPGRGWVAVRANRLEAAEIMAALESGQFYASTGVELEDITTNSARIEVRIKARGDFRFTTTFIGDNGTILKEEHGTVASFALDAATRRLTYVRARVTDSGGHRAWVQPVFTQGIRPADTER